MEDILLSKSDLLLESLKKFYNKDGNKEMLLPIIKQETTISLRLLDWLVTNYSKQNDVNYSIEHNGIVKNFNVWLDYKNQLKAYSKRQFDPFCRRKRIFFILKTGETISFNETEKIKYQTRTDGFITTVGQLNFFRWAITHRVIDYAFKNLNKIESDMLSNADNKKTNLLDKNLNRRKREISKNSKGVYKHTLKVVIQFP